jgi:hypothetical protein
VIVTPLILSLWPSQADTTEERIALRWFDGVVALLAVFVVGIFVMSDRGMFHGMQIRPVVLFPFVVYVAARLTPRATTIVMVAFAAIVLFVTKKRTATVRRSAHLRDSPPSPALRVDHERYVTRPRRAAGAVARQYARA